MQLDYAALERSPVATDPFDHIVLRGFVPPAELAAVTEGLPEFGKGGSFPIDSITLGAHSAALMTELEGDVFRGIVARKFGLDLQDAPTMVTLRGVSREKDGRIHCDSAAKLVTVLLYLNPATAAWARQDGCLRLLRNGTDLDNYAVEVPPIDGTLLVFPNGPATWHGHRPFVGRRYVVQLNYMTNNAAARSEMRRHRLSALVKRLVA